MQKKIKIVWICHFSNSEIRKHLSLSHNVVTNIIRKLLGKKKAKEYCDFAPWVINLIIEFEKFNDIELHIISPHMGLKKWTQNFVHNNINYYFFKPDLPILNIKTDFLFKNPSYRVNRYLVSSLINKIQPDIVNLIGSENPYYSATVLDIENIPIYLSVQTVYTNPNRKIYSSELNNNRWNIEYKIHQKVRYYGCTGRMHRDIILKNNPNAIIFKHFFTIEKPEFIQEVPKEYDFVFFAQVVSAKKGIEDAIEALSLVKADYPKVTLNVVGNIKHDYYLYLFKKIKELKLENDIIFTNYFPIHADMHQHIVKSKIALLPIKLDVISGTIIEAALLNLPVVTYKTTGTPYLNREKECILISNIGNIQSLAKNMLKLLNDEQYAKQLATNAKEFVKLTFENSKSAQRLLDNYYEVIEHYRNGKEINKNQLFNTDEFPLY